MPLNARNIAFPSKGLCLGIDPSAEPAIPAQKKIESAYSAHQQSPESHSNQSAFDAFKNNLENHNLALELMRSEIQNSALPLKPNLAFFLRFGSHGIRLLEDFCAKQNEHHPILLDGKFGEISNTLEAYLDFTFESLKVQAVTINPFLGEETVKQAATHCMESTQGKGRIYVLCATSQHGKFQEPKAVIEVCRKLSNGLKQSESHLPIGLVVGANRTETLNTKELEDSGLPLLCPGVGAQGASLSEAMHTGQKVEKLFPLSRGVFQGGKASPSEALEKVKPLLSELNFEKTK